MSRSDEVTPEFMAYLDEHLKSDEFKRWVDGLIDRLTEAVRQVQRPQM